MNERDEQDTDGRDPEYTRVLGYCSEADGPLCPDQFDWMEIVHPPRLVWTHNGKRVGSPGDTPDYYEYVIVVPHHTTNSLGIVGQLRVRKWHKRDA